MPEPVHRIEKELRTARVRSLLDALAFASSDRELLLRFLRDVFTAHEIKMGANRWAAARLLLAGETQTKTQHILEISEGTVNRANQWLVSGTGGYRVVHDGLISEEA